MENDNDKQFEIKQNYSNGSHLECLLNNDKFGVEENTTFKDKKSESIIISIVKNEEDENKKYIFHNEEMNSIYKNNYKDINKKKENGKDINNNIKIKKGMNGDNNKIYSNIISMFIDDNNGNDCNIREENEMDKDKKNISKIIIVKDKIKVQDKFDIKIDSGNSNIFVGKSEKSIDKKKENNVDEESDNEIDPIIDKKLFESIPLTDYFEILEPIKKGKSRVYKGKFKTIKTQKLAALKIISFKKNKHFREKNQKKLKYIEDHSEITFHYKLKNKNIPNIYGYYSIKDRGVCIAMEYSQYGDLSNFKKNVLKKHIFSETLLCYIASQVLNAILYLHQNKIIHMDIKIQNILIDDYLNVNLTDFSVSMNYKSCEKYIYLLNNGTTRYKSPEVLEEKIIKVEDASKIDIFSFGIVIYVLGLCDYPYNMKDLKDDKEILKNIKEKNLTFENTKNSEMFKSFLKKCLEKDIKKRYNIHEALEDPWIKGSEYILNEKEKLCNGSKFLINMAVGNIIDFNEYIKGSLSSTSQTEPKRKVPKEATFKDKERITTDYTPDNKIEKKEKEGSSNLRNILIINEQ